MEVEINGEFRSVETDAPTVEELLEEIGVEQQQGVAVAVNDRVVARGRWGEETVEDGDRVEIIRAAQGG
ncbi:MAG: sulfur carrier protein ThiS [Bradymonadaceae bacterium]